MTPVQHLSLSTLSQRCQAESNRFFAGEAHDTSFCFELFRRAFVDQDEGAWDLVHGQYLSLVNGWVMRHSAFHSSGEEPDMFANAAFYKMWRAVDAQKFQRFNQLNEILRYLQMCVGSVITDYLRSQDQSELVDELPRSLDIDWDTDVEGEISAQAVQRPLLVVYLGAIEQRGRSCRHPRPLCPLPEAARDPDTPQPAI